MLAFFYAFLQKENNILSSIYKVLLRIYNFKDNNIK